MEGGSYKQAKAVSKQHSVEEEKRSAVVSSPLTHPMRLLTVSKEGALFYRLVEAGSGAGSTDQSAAAASQQVATRLEVEKGYPVYPTATLAKFAPYNGRLAVIADPIGLHIVDCASGKELRLIIRTATISALSISPRDSFFVTCEKFVQGEKNLIVWDILTGKEIAQFEWKKGSKEGTKSLKFTDDE